MAKVIDSQFLVIEGKGEEFLQAGMGAGGVQDLGTIKGGTFDGFSMINIEGGGCLVCDFGNEAILPSETCYYIAVLNSIYCDTCFKRWHDKAVRYPEDSRFEKAHYRHTVALLQEAGVEVDETAKRECL